MVIIFVVILVFFLFFIISLLLYKTYVSGFKDKDQKIEEISKYLGDKLTYRMLKSRCPECTNIDYYKAKGFI